MQTDIVLLAMSDWERGLCCAGKLITQNGIGGFVRLLSPNGGPLHKHDIQYEDGTLAKPLDLIRVDLAEHCPEGHQSENWRLSTTPFDYHGSLPERYLQLCCDSPASLWSRYGSSSHGENDRVWAAAARKMTESLAFIRLSNPVFHVACEDGVKLNCRMSMVYGGIRYKLAVTDPAFKAEVCGQGVGDYTLTNEGPNYACISLGTLFHGFHYKLVASVLCSGGSQ